MHDHALWVGTSEDDLVRVACSALAAASANAELMLFVSEPSAAEHLRRSVAPDALLEEGTIMFAALEDAYLPDLGDRLAVVHELLASALARGRSGLRVVADNSSLLGGGDAAFARWLAWEAIADEVQARLPVTGICYFDRSQVSSERLSDVATLHPVLCAGVPDPRFQLFRGDDAISATGAWDIFSVDQLERVLHSAPALTETVLDVSELDFLGHHALLALHRLGVEGRPIRVRGASAIVRRLCDILELTGPALELC